MSPLIFKYKVIKVPILYTDRQYEKQTTQMGGQHKHAVTLIDICCKRYMTGLQEMATLEARKEE
jgi:hypothetical protein